MSNTKYIVNAIKYIHCLKSTLEANNLEKTWMLFMYSATGSGYPLLSSWLRPDTNAFQQSGYGV